MSANEDRFDVEQVTQFFENSLRTPDDILIDEYLCAYEQINKFFCLLGSIFSFVSSDVRAKIDRIYELRSDSENGDSFQTFKTMMEYEKTSGLLSNSNYVSGSRTLLRLHRGLEFFYIFLTRLSELCESDKVSTCCKGSYNETLAKHHPWMVRKAALLAMYALPTQAELFKKVCANPAQSIEKLPDMLENAKIVYDRTNALYLNYELNELP